MAISYGDGTIIYTRQAIRDRLKRIASALPLEIYPTLMDEVAAAAYRQLRQNASVKIVFFDLLVTIAMLIPAWDEDGRSAQVYIQRGESGQGRICLCRTLSALSGL